MFNSIQFYGSFVGIKHQYELNVADDLDVILDSDFFNKHHNELFTMQFYDEFISSFKCIQKPIKINQNTSLGLISSLETLDDDLGSNNNNNEIMEDVVDVNVECIDLNVECIDGNERKSLSLDLNEITKSASNIKISNENISQYKNK